MVYLAVCFEHRESFVYDLRVYIEVFGIPTGSAHAFDPLWIVGYSYCFGQAQKIIWGVDFLDEVSEIGDNMALVNRNKASGYSC